MDLWIENWMDGWTHGSWMDGRVEWVDWSVRGCTCGWKNRWMYGQMGVQMDGCVDWWVLCVWMGDRQLGGFEGGQMNAWIYGLKHREMHRQMSGWVNGWV